MLLSYSFYGCIIIMHEKALPTMHSFKINVYYKFYVHSSFDSFPSSSYPPSQYQQCSLQPVLPQPYIYFLCLRWPRKLLHGVAIDVIWNVVEEYDDFCNLLTVCCRLTPERLWRVISAKSDRSECKFIPLVYFDTHMAD